MIKYKGMEKYISSQVKYWNHQKAKILTTEKLNHLPFVTISREYGSGGYDIADKMISIFNDELKQSPVWAAYDRTLLNKIMTDMGFSQSLAETMTNEARKALTNIIQTTFSTFPSQISVYKKLVETICLLAANGNVIIVGRAGNIITKSITGGYHVRIVATMEYKVMNLMKKMDLTKLEAEKLIYAKSSERENFVKEYVRFDPADPHNYDLVINDSRHTVDQTARLIIDGMIIKKLLPQL